MNRIAPITRFQDNPVGSPVEINLLIPVGSKPIGSQVIFSNHARELCDRCLNDYKDLISFPYYSWYCKMYNYLGESVFRTVAEQARQGNSPKKLFSYLLKKHSF